MVLIALTLGLLVLLFLIMVALTRAFERNRVADIIDWKPTRSPEVEAQNEVDDVRQMIEAQNAYRRSGAPRRSPRRTWSARRARTRRSGAGPRAVRPRVTGHDDE